MIMRALEFWMISGYSGIAEGWGRDKARAASFILCTLAQGMIHYLNKTRRDSKSNTTCSQGHLFIYQNRTPLVLGISPSRPATGVHAILNATASALNALSALW